MAVITPVKDFTHDSKMKIYLWETIGQGDTCSPVKLAYTDDVTIFAFGTFSGTAKIALHGSPEASNGSPTLFAALASSGTAIDLGAASAKVVDENAAWYKPVLTGGDGSTDIDVYVVSK